MPACFDAVWAKGYTNASAPGPPPPPDHYHGQCWMDRGCDEIKRHATDKWKWDYLCADQAWDAAISHHQAHRAPKGPGTSSFPNTLARFFNSTEGMNCHILRESNGCNHRRDCIPGLTRSPAGILILDSFVVLSDVSWSMVFDSPCDRPPF